MKEAANMAEAAELLGVPYRTLAYWVSQGTIDIPKDHVARHGNPVPWTTKQTAEASAIVALRGVLSMQEIRKAGKFLRKLGFNPYSGGPGVFAVIDGKPGRRRLVRIIGPKDLIEIVSEAHAQRLLLPIKPMGNSKRK